MVAEAVAPSCVTPSAGRTQEANMLSIVTWIVFGLVVGVIAKLLMPGHDPGGIVITVLLGIAGALLGGFVGRVLGFYGPGNTAGFLMSILGAVLILFVYRRLHRAPA
jgi:uncharacterized membrane protein YeaQ/YmgE (transglycosylase-associated protein family)